MKLDNNQSEKISFLKAILQQWKLIFKYEGTATKREYWCVLVFNLVIGVLATLAIYKGDYLKIAGIVLCTYLVVALIPMLSLTVRRLHDTGKSGWWMCLALVVVVGLIVLAVMCMRPAEVETPPEEFYPEVNIPVAVYGPPEIPEEEIEDDSTGTEVVFFPEMNVPEEVYGPPEFFE